MDKKELFYKYTDFSTLKSIGNAFLSEIKSYLPISDWIGKAGMYQIALWAIHVDWIKYWMILLFLIIKFYAMIFINWLGGRIAIKTGLYKAQQHYNTKQEHLNPYQVELRKTVENIAEAVKAKSEFTKL